MLNNFGIIAIASSFFSSLFISKLIVRYRQKIDMEGDTYLASIPSHAIHKTHTPRIGGIAILLGSALGLCLIWSGKDTDMNLILKFWIAVTPVFMVAFAEDITQRIPVKLRGLAVIIGALLAIGLIDCSVTRTDIGLLDLALTTPAVAIAFSSVAILGLTNSYNLIDGINGLAGGLALLSLFLISHLALTQKDYELFWIATIIGSSALGFLVLNFPYGKLFLGDSGAYTLGFCSGMLSILLVNRNPSIPAFLVVVINSHPIIEVFFTIYRRKRKATRLFAPDKLHLHTLIFKRFSSKKIVDQNLANGLTSVIIWVLAIVVNLLSIIFIEHSKILYLIFGLHIWIYISLYSSIVNFRVHRLLSLFFVDRIFDCCQKPGNN